MEEEEEKERKRSLDFRLACQLTTELSVEREPQRSSTDDPRGVGGATAVVRQSGRSISRGGTEWAGLWPPVCLLSLLMFSRLPTDGSVFNSSCLALAAFVGSPVCLVLSVKAMRLLQCDGPSRPRAFFIWQSRRVLAAVLVPCESQSQRPLPAVRAKWPLEPRSVTRHILAAFHGAPIDVTAAWCSQRLVPQRRQQQWCEDGRETVAPLVVTVCNSRGGCYTFNSSFNSTSDWPRGPCDSERGWGFI